MLLLNINGKYACSDMSDIEKTKSRSLGFQSLISGKGTEFGHMLLLLKINRKHISGVQWHRHFRPWVTLKYHTDSQGQSHLEALYLVKEPC